MLPKCIKFNDDIVSQIAGLACGLEDLAVRVKMWHS